MPTLTTIASSTASTAASSTELHAALLQFAVTLGLTALCGALYRVYRRPYMLWLTAAWALYLVRLSAIISFLLTTKSVWLFWHQVATGWAALGLLGAAVVFSRRPAWRWGYALLALFPLVWSYIAIFELENFLLAAGPAVLFLSGATLWTAGAFWRYQRRVGSNGARVLAVSLTLWGIHHLDYPFLRARGAWAPWGYYLDILFELAVGCGIVLLVLDDLRRGLDAMVALSGELQTRGRSRDVRRALLERVLSLPAVRGASLFLRDGAVVRCELGVGACADWGATAERPGAADVTSAPTTQGLVARSLDAGRPQISRLDAGAPSTDGYAYAAALPVFNESVPVGALVIVGDARDPFAALDAEFLLALGRQVGAALENAALTQRLEARTAELARLSTRMVQQHEDERRRLSRELHDETAQVLAAVKMELGLLRAESDAALGARLERLLGLMDAGIRSIRSVTHDLRPSLLDDLGLLPALRSLVADFEERSGLPTRFEAPLALPALTPDAELALFRALQEALANVARHAQAASIQVTLAIVDGRLRLRVVDDGRGFMGGAASEGTGLAGLRERLGAVGGVLSVRDAAGRGTELSIELPALPAEVV